MSRPTQRVGIEAHGTPFACPDCKEPLPFQVLHSMAGYYIGTSCQCGPYSRDSEYLKTRDAAEVLLVEFQENDGGIEEVMLEEIGRGGCLSMR